MYVHKGNVSWSLTMEALLRSPATLGDGTFPATSTLRLFHRSLPLPFIPLRSMHHFNDDTTFPQRAFIRHHDDPGFRQPHG